MAFEWVSGYGGQLSSDDVLYHGGRLDALLFLSDDDGKVYGKGYAAGSGNVSKYAGKPAGFDRFDDSDCSGGNFHLLHWTAKGR